MLAFSQNAIPKAFRACASVPVNEALLHTLPEIMTLTFFTKKKKNLGSIAKLLRGK